MVTVELKDAVLKSLVDVGLNLSVNIHEDSQIVGVDDDTYSAILDQFERMKLLTQQKCLGGVIYVNLAVDAHDLVRRGGFLVQEELLKANIEKLGLEIDLLCKELSPDLLEKAQKITSIGASVLSALRLMN